MADARKRYINMLKKPLCKLRVKIANYLCEILKKRKRGDEETTDY